MVRPKVKVYIAENPQVSAIIGTSAFKALGISLTQLEAPKIDNSSSITVIAEEPQPSPKPKKKVTDPDILELRRKHHKSFYDNTQIVDFEVLLHLRPNAEISQHRGRVVPIALQGKVDDELRRLVRSSHWERIDSVEPDVFISPIAITVKKDGTVKLAADCTALNDNSIPTKFQMPNLDDLFQRVSRIVAENKDKPLWFSTIDLQYAYGQMRLSEEMAKHSVFAIQGGQMSGFYRAKTGFYGHTNMPAKLKKALEMILGPEELIWLYDLLQV